MPLTERQARTLANELTELNLAQATVGSHVTNSQTHYQVHVTHSPVGRPFTLSTPDPDPFSLPDRGLRAIRIAIRNKRAAERADSQARDAQAKNTA